MSKTGEIRIANNTRNKISSSLPSSFTIRPSLIMRHCVIRFYHGIPLIRTLIAIVATRIILLFIASLRDNLFVFLFSLFCYYLSLLALRNTPVDYVTTPFTYSFIYCACFFFWIVF